MNTTLGIRKFELNLQKIAQNKNTIFGLMLFAALIAFEIFNFSTTEFALVDVLGGLTFAGLKWATILSFAFCGIDFAGVAKLFSPSDTKEEPMEVWYLFGSWILAAGMNATLTWWGVTIAISSHVSQGSTIFSGETIQKVVPVFVAVMVWLIRIMIIGSFTASGEKLFSTPAAQPSNRRAAPIGYNNVPATQGYSASASNTSFRSGQPVKPQYKPVSRANEAYMQTMEPSYHNFNGKSASD